MDLTGAFEGHPAHTGVIGRIAAAVAPIPVECGGGLRTDADLEAVLAAGVRRAILGTRALAEPDRLAALAAHLVFAYYCDMSKRQFGGLSGDLAGWFLVQAEKWMLIVLVAWEYVEVLL